MDKSLFTRESMRTAWRDFGVEERIMWKDEKNYHFCDWIRDLWLDKLEAKMNLDCPDSYQVRGIKEEDEEK